MPDDTNKVLTMYALANMVVNAKPEETIQLADDALKLAVKIDFKRAQSFLMMSKGDAYRNMGKPGDAIKAYEEGIKNAKPINYYKGMGIMSNKVANTLADLGKNTEAIARFKEAVVYDSIAKLYAHQSEAYRTIGEIYVSIGEHSLAMGYFIKALKVAQDNKESVQVGNAYMSMGNSQQYQKDYDKALESFTKSRTAMEEGKNGYGMAGAYLSIANIYYYKGDYENSLENYKVSREMWEQMNAQTLVAKLNVDIGNVFMQQGKYDEALVCYEHAVPVFEQANDSDAIAAVYGNLGSAYRGLKKYDESEKWFMKALSIGREHNYYQRLKEAYSDASKLYFETGRYKEAYLYKDSANVIDSIIVGQEHIRLSKEMEARFNNRENEAKITHLNEVAAEQAEIDKKQKQIIIAVSAGLGIVLLLSFFLFSANAARKKANLQLENQNKVIAEKNKDITDSITYALRIQKSVMSDERILQKAVSDHFIFNKPRDIVSGDFFWLAQKDNRTYIAVADCTGHGVPGALVSVVGINLLNKIIEMPGTPSPAAMLELLHTMMINALNKDAEVRESNDGMDIALLCLDKNSNQAIFAGAGRPLYYADKNGFNYFKGDRYSVAGEKKESDPPFSEQTISLSGAMNFYLSSDGFVDQFGEKTGKKFLSKRFQELLQNISQLPMNEQQERIEKEFDSWKGGLEQVDDILVMGIRV
jgi:tetratricopeptide (TPR) repeat protein